MIYKYVCKKSIVFKNFWITHHLLNIYKPRPIAFAIVLILEHLGAAVDNECFAVRLDNLYKWFCRLKLFVQIVY